MGEYYVDEVLLESNNEFYNQQFQNEGVASKCSDTVELNNQLSSTYDGDLFEDEAYFDIKARECCIDQVSYQ